MGAQVASGPSVVKASLLDPVKVQLYVALGKVGPLGLDRSPYGRDGVADVPARAYGGDGDGASGACASPALLALGSCSRSAGSLLYAPLDYFLRLWHALLSFFSAGFATSPIISLQSVG